jgi:hypothetical protein
MNRRKSNVRPLSERWRVLLCVLSALFTLTLVSSKVQADIVADWNGKAGDTMVAQGVTSGVGPARTLAMMHAAMFNAVNAVGKRYALYMVTTVPDAAGASPEAAAHAAARRVLADLYPKQKPALDAAFDAAIAKLPDGAAKVSGILAGEAAAVAMLANRKTDGFDSADTYRPVTSPGVYVVTPLPVMSHVAGVKPFALQSVSQFRPGPPPALDSPQWARDYNETKELGAAKSTKRTAWQTETGRFWVLSGALAWNEAARELLASKPLPLTESARLFAHLNIALTDAFLAIFDAKYHYSFWRPITAIRNGDRDGNDATERDAGWTPLINTPMHPEYPCAHCVCDGAAGAVLKSVFGTGTLPEFTLTYAAMPGVTRKYTSIQQLEDEVAMARIWGGVHYRTSNEVGNAIGRKVGEYVLKNYLQAVR